MTQQEFQFAKASPTKAFFIEMLTRDIALLRAIVDLVDNCVDGAIRERGWAGENVDLEAAAEDDDEDDEDEDDDENEDESEDDEESEDEEEASVEDPEDEDDTPSEARPFAGLTVTVSMNKTEFKITDNCGGIPIEVARDYAFCFGRPDGMERTDHSIGQFGVGMKRALFKLGRQITIESRTGTSDFSLEIDVEKWKQEHNEWQFPFKTADAECSTPPDKIGTTIHVTQLHDAVATEFDLENFEHRLIQEISAAHQNSITKGLRIEINQTRVQPYVTEFLQSNKLYPAKKVSTYDSRSPAPVKALLLAGIGISSPRLAGWYVFCNGRMVVVANKTDLTGWGTEEGDSRIPRYHNQYSRFRGFVYFESIDASKLPWNTTKTGVDVDSGIYKKTLQNMILLMRPVIDFLNELDREINEGVPKVLTKLVDVASPVSAESADTKKQFQYPPPSTKKLTKAEKKVITRRIQYDKPMEEIEEVMEALGVTTLKEVGEQTFEYYRQLEVE